MPPFVRLILVIVICAVLCVLIPELGLGHPWTWILRLVVILWAIYEVMMLASSRGWLSRG